jgi:Group II intron, maturase-specific domain
MFNSLEVKVLYPSWSKRRVSEAQGRRREARSERSVEQTREPMNKNWIRGLRCRESEQVIAKPTSIKSTGGKFSGCKQMRKELTAYLRGWKNYFGFCQTPSLLQQLDRWIRHRLRSRIWKQWKHGQQRYGKLRQRGVDTDLAAQTAGSPHGPWRVANSPALSIAFPLAYFDSLGLPRLFDGLA